MIRAVFAGGGTGGHLFPAIAVADEVKRMAPGSEIVFVGTSGNIEARVVPAKGYEFRAIWISGLQRRRMIANVLFPLKIVVALIQSIGLLRRFRPQAVVGTGGYVSGPVVYAATLIGIPTLIHEQNSYPGITTRLLARRVNEVHVTFERSRQYIDRRAKVQVTGNPTRSDLEGMKRSEALAFFGFTDERERKTLLVFGGSRGAHSMNMAMIRSLKDLVHDGVRVIWQTGTDDAPAALDAARECPGGMVAVMEFIDRMECAYAACDLVLSRAGATTIAELTRLGKPAILVPYPFAAADHQTENARALQEAGAAIVVADKDIATDLFTEVRTVLDEGNLRRMSVAMKKLGKPEAARIIAGRIIALANG